MILASGYPKMERVAYRYCANDLLGADNDLDWKKYHVTGGKEGVFYKCEANAGAD